MKLIKLCGLVEEDLLNAWLQMLMWTLTSFIVCEFELCHLWNRGRTIFLQHCSIDQWWQLRREFYSTDLVPDDLGLSSNSAIYWLKITGNVICLYKNHSTYLIGCYEELWARKVVPWYLQGIGYRILWRYEKLWMLKSLYKIMVIFECKLCVSSHIP